MNPSILVVEDEHKLAKLISDYLIAEHFEVTHLDDGSQVLPWITSHSCDLVLLDVMLPNMNGIEICRSIRRQSNIGVIMVTAMIDEIDRLIGLDDYVCKPFSPKEVIARVKAVLRRTNQTSDHTSPPSPLILDSQRMVAIFESNSLELTLIEFRILEVLTSEPHRIFSRTQLMNHAYDDNRVVSDRTIDSHIKKLRKKIAGLCNPDIVQSVYGVGYRYDPDALER